MKKKLFVVDGFRNPHIGYTNGDNWNGWATPYFEKEEAMEIMHEFNECAESKMEYDPTYDQFFVLIDGDVDIWKGTDLETEEGIKHLYGIGAYAWVWESINKLTPIACRVQDFLCNYDTYEYRDQYDDDILEQIKVQLEDFTVLKHTVAAIYNEYMTEEEIFNKLGEVLKL